MPTATRISTRTRLHQALTAAGGQPRTTAALIADVVTLCGRGPSAKTAERHLTALTAAGQAARVGVAEDGAALWAAASVPPDATAGASADVAGRLLDVLDGAGWRDAEEIHATLAAQPEGALSHPEVKATLRDRVASGQVERQGLTPPCWRVVDQDAPTA